MAPRPRPRAVQKAVSSSSNVAAGLSSRSLSSEQGSCSKSTAVPLSSPTGAKRVIVVEDTDEMFMRNRNRSSKTWQKLEKINKKAEEEEKGEDSDASQDEDEDLTPRKRYKPKKKDSIPTWQKNQAFARVLSQEVSDTSDNDHFEITGDDSTPTGLRNAKRKRPRSRSRSITPPPVLSAYQIQNAKRIVRETLEAAVRPAPTIVIDLDDDPIDTINLQPEFMELARRIRNESQSENSIVSGPVAGEELVLTVKWHLHPLMPNGKDEEWQYKVDKADNFRDLFEAVAEDAAVPSANVILTYQGNRFFPSITPHTLKIWADTAEFSAYEKTAYEYIQKHHMKPSFSQEHVDPVPLGGISPETIGIDSDDDNVVGSSNLNLGNSSYQTNSQTQTQESDADSEVELGEKFKVVLRSAVTGANTINLVVRRTTKCGAIVKAFLKKAGLEEVYPELFENSGSNTGNSRKGRKSSGRTQAGTSGRASGKNPQLCIDGEKQDNNAVIGDADLEDGDMVEVVGL